MRGSLKWLIAVLSFLFICPLVYAAGESAGNFYDLGVFAFEEGKFQQSADFLQKAVAANPGDAYANFYLGKTYIKLDALPEAQQFLSAANMIDPEIEGLAYELGMLNHQLDNHDQAVLFFKKAVHDDPDDVLAVYHTGISLFEMEKYDEALDYFLRSSEMSPSVKSNGFYYAGVCYYYLSYYDQAVDKFNYVKANAETDSLKEDAGLWIQTIRSDRAVQKPYNLYLKAGYQYDDNVLLAASDLDLEEAGVSDEDDYKTLLYFSGNYKLINQENVNFGIGYSHYQTCHNDLKEYDIKGSIGEVFADYKFYSVKIGLSYIPSYYWVDADSYLMQHQITPEITWQINENDSATLTYSYDRNNYFTDNNRDGHANEVSLDAYHGFAGLNGYLFCGISYEDNSASHDDEYFTERGCQAGVSWNIFEKTNLTVYGDFYDKEYDHVDSNYLVKRNDARYFASVSIAQNLFFNWFTVSAEYTYTKNDSNITDYDYERNTGAIYVVVNL